MFAIDYNTVSDAALSSRGDVAPAGSDELSLDAPRSVQAGQTFMVGLNLKGAGDIQGLSAQLAWNSAVAEPLSVSSGDLLDSQHGVALSAKPGNVDVAMLGVRDLGLSGEGTLATVTFRATGAGDPAIKLAKVEARNAANHPVSLDGAHVAAPTATEFLGGRPNPFRESSLLGCSLAKRGPVQLAIYSVDGRRMRTLANDTRDAGVYRIAWDGRDERGNAVRPGVFFARLTTVDGHITRTLLRVQ